MEKEEVSEETRKLYFYERVYIPFLRDTFDEFIDELGRSSIYMTEPEQSQRTLELLGNIAVLLREPKILDSSSKECH